MATRLLKRDKIGILERLPLFETCTHKELSEVAAITVEAQRDAGQYLTWEGRQGGLMFVIVDGEAEVVATGKNGRPRVIGRRLGPGDVVGELSLIDGQARSASVRAVTPVRVIEINSDDFRRLANRSPRFVKNLLRALSLKVRQMELLSG